MRYIGRDETFQAQKLEMFEMEARKILKQTRHTQRSKQEYVPLELRQELDLPADMEENKINFQQVISKDCSIKRKTPLWSGQDVLDIGLNNELSNWVV